MVIAIRRTQTCRHPDCDTTVGADQLTCDKHPEVLPPPRSGDQWQALDLQRNTAAHHQPTRSGWFEDEQGRRP